MKRLLPLVLLLLLLCGCAKTPAQIPEQAQVGELLALTPSYETRYFARTVGMFQDEETLERFQSAYTQVLSAVTETSKAIPTGDEYLFRIYHKKGETQANLYLRLVDDGKGCWLELKPRRNKPDWSLTYSLSREAAEPLLAFFEGEPTGKPHLEGAPNGRVVPLSERLQEDWPIVMAQVIDVSDEIKEFSLNEALRYGWLYREFTVEVKHCCSGGLSEGTKLTYRVFGGETEDYSFSVPGAPQVAVGDHVLIAAPEHSFATEYNLFPLEMVNEYYGTCSIPAGILPDRYSTTQSVIRLQDFYRCVTKLRQSMAEYNGEREPLPERVTERELAELRLEYPRHGVFSSTADYFFPDEWKDFADHNYSGLLVLDFIGEYRIQPPNEAVLEGAEMLVPQLQNVVRMTPLEQGAIFLFARVEEILIGCEGLQVGDLIPVAIGTSYLYSPEEILFAMGGQRFVCPVTAVEPGGNYHLPNSYSASMFSLFFLTPNDVALYFCEPHCTCMDICSGMYLPAFTELFRRMLFAPVSP